MFSPVKSVTCPSEILASTCLKPPCISRCLGPCSCSLPLWKDILTEAGLGHLRVVLALLVDLSVLLGAVELPTFFLVWFSVDSGYY